MSEKNPSESIFNKKISMPLIFFICIGALMFILLIITINMSYTASKIAGHLNPVIDQYNELLDSCNPQGRNFIPDVQKLNISVGEIKEG